MRLSASIRFNVAQVTGVTIGRVWRTMLLVRRIKVTAGGSRFRVGAIAELVNMEPVFARGETSNIGHDFYGIARGCERNRAGNIIAGCWM